MATFNVAACLLLALCCASTSAIYRLCDDENIKTCEGMVPDTSDGDWDQEAICSARRSAHSCFSAVQDDCDIKDKVDLYNEIKVNMDAIELDLMGCPDEEPGVGLTMWNFAENDETTKHPWGEPTPEWTDPPGETHSEPWWQPSMDPWTNPTGEPHSDPWWQPSTDPWTYPTGEPHSEPWWQPSTGPWTYPTGEPHSEPWGAQSTPYPWADPNNVCSWEAIGHCNDKVSNDLMYWSDNEKCSVWRDALECFHRIEQHCHDDAWDHVQKRTSDLKNNMEFTCDDHHTSYYPTMKPSPATAYADECTSDTVQACDAKVPGYYTHDYSDKDKCASWEDALKCYQMIHHNCYDSYLYQSVQQSIDTIESDMGYNDCGDDQCSWDAAKSCAEWATMFEGYTEDMCPYWRQAAQCYRQLEPYCKDYQVADYVHQDMEEMRAKLEDRCHDECNWDVYQDCLAYVENADQEHNMTKICSMTKKTKKCFDNFMHSCHQYDEVWNSANSYMQSLENTLQSYCAETDHDNKPEAPECTWETFADCTGSLETLEQDAAGDYMKMCRIWWKSDFCMNRIVPYCTDHSILHYINSTKDTMKSHMSWCNDLIDCPMTNADSCLEDVKYAWDTEELCRAGDIAKNCLHDLSERYECLNPQEMDMLSGTSMPWLRKKMEECEHTDRPKPDSSKCTLEAFEDCTSPLETMESETGGDAEAMCIIWWRSRHCMKRLRPSCMGNYVDDYINSSMAYMNSAMSYCQHFVSCSMEDRHTCVEEVKNAWDMESMCNAAGWARECLTKIGDQYECQKEDEMDLIHKESLPWVEQKIEDCMYGNGDGSLTGDGDVYGPTYGSATHVQVSSTTTSLVALMTALVIKLAAAAGRG